MAAKKYLTDKDFKKMIRSISPNERSYIMGKYLKNYIVFSNDKCYIVDPKTIVYEQVKSAENKILSKISSLLLKSWNVLDNETKEDIKEIKNYNKIFENAYIKTYLPQLIDELTNDKIKFDLYFNEIHFLNGFVDLQTKEFKKENWASILSRHIYHTITIKRQRK